MQCASSVKIVTFYWKLLITGIILLKAAYIQVFICYLINIYGMYTCVIGTMLIQGGSICNVLKTCVIPR